MLWQGEWQAAGTRAYLSAVGLAGLGRPAGVVCLDKGCYLGQELTARTYFRGVTRKRIMPVHILGAIDAAPEYVHQLGAADADSALIPHA